MEVRNMNRLWYAIIMYQGDTDWGTGSDDLEDAKKKAIEMNAYCIAVIDGDECIDEIYDFDN